jgi:hypothetical protein
LSKSPSAIGPSRPITRFAAPMPAQFTAPAPAVRPGGRPPQLGGSRVRHVLTATPPISAATLSASFALVADRDPGTCTASFNDWRPVPMHRQ